MSTPLGPLYHWSPQERRQSIIRSGLRPTTPTAVEHYAQAVGPRSLLPSLGFDTAKAVCLGTSPSHAWSLCGAIWGDRDETWDLWQVTLDDNDEVIPMRFTGYRLDEIRVLNRIPKARVWHVGSRIVGTQRWSCRN